jgi:hypothetical protein
LTSPENFSEHSQEYLRQSLVDAVPTGIIESALVTAHAMSRYSAGAEPGL